MARMKKQIKISVSGLSVKDILSMRPEELLTLNKKNLSSIASRLVSASNKRIRRLAQTEEGQLSPAYQTYAKRGRQFSIKGKNVNQIRNEIKNMEHFLNLKTSTVSGWNKVRKEAEKRIGKMTKAQSKKFWKTYHRLEEEEGGALAIIGDSDKIQKTLHSEVTSHKRISVDELTNKMMERLDEMYEEQMLDDLIDAEDEDDIFSIDNYF